MRSKLDKLINQRLDLKKFQPIKIPFKLLDEQILFNSKQNRFSNLLDNTVGSNINIIRNSNHSNHSCQFWLLHTVFIYPFLHVQCDIINIT